MFIISSKNNNKEPVIYFAFTNKNDWYFYGILLVSLINQCNGFRKISWYILIQQFKNETTSLDTLYINNNTAH